MSWFLDSLWILFILFIGYNGFKKGFIQELGGLIGLILSALIAISNSAKLSARINELFFIDSRLSISLSFILLFFLALLSSKIITRLVHVAFLSKTNILINQSIGFVFAMIKGYVIVMIFFWFMGIIPLKKWEKVIDENSRLARVSDSLRIDIVDFFHWEDPIALSESYIKNLTQP